MAALLGGALAVPAPAVAAPKCGPPGGPAPAAAPWALNRLDPAAAWRVTKGQGVTVAVIDSGVSPTHPLLRGRVLSGEDFNQLAKLHGQCDLVGHGTLIAGIIAGREGTGAPYTGIAPEARILPVRVLADNQRAFDESIPAEIGRAIRWSVDHDADVINLSLVTLDDPALKAAVDYALGKGVILVAAAGNRQENQQDQPAYPAAYPGVIAVAGVDENGEHVGSSVTGDYVDIAAPGLNIVGPAPQGAGYRAEPQGGTSFATAYVSGAAAGRDAGAGAAHRSAGLAAHRGDLGGGGRRAAGRGPAGAAADPGPGPATQLAPRPPDRAAGRLNRAGTGAGPEKHHGPDPGVSRSGAAAVRSGQPQTLELLISVVM
ncbi:Thermophilic serine proteinase [Micromonospora sp. MH33]|nr:Thermophilic serine proteinase [Micromonospora sp. MH33]